MNNKNINKNMKIIKKLTNDGDFIRNNKRSIKDFTRNRSLTFQVMFILFLKKGLKSLQLLLNESFGKLFGNKTVSASAYSQAKDKFMHTAFIELNQKAILDPFYNDKDYKPYYKSWKGHRLLAVDGSKLYLPNTQNIKNEFGETKSQNQQGDLRPYVGALLSTLYDVRNNLAIDSLLGHGRSSELDFAIDHLKHTNKNDVVIYDRGYGSYIQFALHITQDSNFVCRCQSNTYAEAQELFNNDCKINSKTITIKPTHTSKNRVKNDKKGILKNIPEEIKVRFIRVILDNGEIEVLATSLLNEKKYPTEIFKDLYNARWGVEIYYDIIKNRLNLENFTGHSAESIRQDVFSTIFISNFESLMTMETNEELEKKCREKKLKYEQQVNKQVSFNIIKNKAIELFFSDEEDGDLLYNQLKEIFKTNPTIKRKGRKINRKIVTPRQQTNYYKRKKKTCF